MCAYLQYGLKVKPPRSIPFTLNNAVDRLLKDEFDRCRAAGEPHPWQSGAPYGMRPWSDPRLDRWRSTLQGLERLIPGSGVKLYGALDDIWIDDGGELHVVDYKATGSKSAADMTSGWSDSYRRQVEVYQWLLRGYGLPVSDVAFFLFCTVDDSSGFGGSLRFVPRLVPHVGSDAWVPERAHELVTLLRGQAPPMPGPSCESCVHRSAAAAALAAAGGSTIGEPRGGA